MPVNRSFYQSFIDEYKNDYSSELREEDEERRKKRESLLSPTTHRKLEEFTKEQEDLLINSKRGLGKPHGAISSTFDFISRPLYGLTKYFDVTLNEKTPSENYLSLIYRGTKEGLKELVDPEDRLLWGDVIKRVAPRWSATNKEKVEILGFMGDVVVDPLNAISLGTGTVFKESLGIVGKSGKILSLSKPGKNVFQKFIKEAGEEGLEGISRYNRATELMQEVLSPTEIPKVITKKQKRKIVSTESDDISSTLSSLVDEQEVGVGQAVGVFNEDFLDHIIQKGTLPGSLLPLSNKVEKVGEAFKGKGISQTAIKNRLSELGEGTKGFSRAFEKTNKAKETEDFTLVYRTNKGKPTAYADITLSKDKILIHNIGAPKANKVSAGRILKEVKKITGDRKVVVTGPISKEAESSFLKLFKDKASFPTQSELLVLARKRSKALRASLIDSVNFTQKVFNAAGKKKTPIGVVFPRDSVLGIARRTKAAYVDSTIDPHKLRFILPGRKGLHTLDETRNIVKFGDLSSEAKRLEELKRTQTISKRILSEEGIKSTKKLLDQGGLKLFGKTVISGEDFNNFMKITGLNRAVRAVDEIPSTKELRTAGEELSIRFNLNSILEKHFPEWMRFRRGLEAQRFETIRMAEKAFDSVFGNLKTKDREEIGDLLAAVQQQTKSLADELGLENPSLELGRELLRDAIDKSKLTKEQKAAVIKLRQSMNDVFKTERQAGLAQQMIVNYFPARYENIKDVKKYKQMRTYQREGVTKPYTAGKERQFKDVSQAIAAGYEPVLDAGRLYLMRFFESTQQLREAEWKRFLDSAYGSWEKAPSAIQADLARLGEVFYPKGAGHEPTLFGKIWDGINKAFRRSATIVRPAFLAKQGIGNFSQLYAAVGIDAFKIFDPTTMDLALSVLARDRPIFGFTDVWGIKYSADDINRMLKSFPIRKNVSIEGIGQATEHRLIRDLTKDIYTRRRFKEGSQGAFEGVLDLVQKGAGYLHWPAYLEDAYRLGAFFSGVKMGHSPAKAFEIVDKAFFNYTSGLTELEQSIRRSLIPFLSFQRFGAELLLRTGTTKPGRLALGGKGVKGFFEVWNKVAGGDELNESERRVLPPYLLEQVKTFERFDEKGLAVFRTFNNMFFLDVVGFMQVNDKGDFDAQETLIKGALAQLTPFIKVPLELVRQRQFFTDRALSGAYAGNIGDVDPDKLFRNLSVMVGLHGGAATGILGGILGAIPDQSQEETWFKRLISWEENIDPITGERDVYINPYIFTVATSVFPALNEAIKTSKNDRGFWDNVLSTAFGVNVSKRDLSKDALYTTNRLQREKDKAIQEYRAYLKLGRLTSAEKAYEDLEELMEYTAQELEVINQEPIRGAQ